MSSLAEYQSVYGNLPSVKGGNGLAKLFVGGGHQHARPLVTRSPRTIIAGPYRGDDPEAQPDAVVSSFDPPYLNFLQKVRSTFASTFKVELNNEQFSTNGVHVTPDTLGCVAGYMMTPMSYVPVDNADYRKSLGLGAGYSRDEKTIARNVWRIVFSEWDACDINLPKISTSGVRRFNYDPVWKADFAAMLFDPVEFERMLKKVRSKDWVGLIDEYEMVFMLYMQTRGQAENPSKKRQVFDLEYALSAGKEGNDQLFADKRVAIDGRSYPEMGGMRARNVQAGPWAVNAPLQILATGHMRSLFRRFPDVFHVTTPEQIEALVNGHHVVCGDVTEYDRSMSRDAIETVFEVAREFWDEAIVEIARKLAFAPYYSKPLDLEGNRGVFVGDPRRPDDYEVVCGNRSGHAWTSLIAKVNKVIDDLIRFHNLGHKVIGVEASWLRGEQIIKIINNGDDMVNYSKSKSAIAAVRAAFANPKLGHYIVKEEVGQVFSGYMLILHDAEKLVYHARARLFSGFEKMLVPERSAGSKHRKCWPVGILTRVNQLDPWANPNNREAWDIFHTLWRTDMEPVYGRFLDLITAAVETMPISFQGLNQADKEVLDDPEKIHYKWLPEELSRDVRRMLISKIPFQEFSHIPKTYYQGSVNEEHYSPIVLAA